MHMITDVECSYPNHMKASTLIKIDHVSLKFLCAKVNKWDDIEIHHYDERF